MDREHPHRDREISRCGRRFVDRRAVGTSGDGTNAEAVRAVRGDGGGRMKGRHGRSTMAPLSAPVSAPVSAPMSAPTRGRTCERRSAHNVPQQKEIPVVGGPLGPAERAARWAARGGTARVPSEGGATPRFTVVLAPAPCGAVPDLRVAPPSLGTTNRRRVVLGARRRRMMRHDRDTVRARSPFVHLKGA